MNNKLVSIVITNYNYGQFLAEAVDSALSQTWPTVEVIVVDDGSTDDSTEIMRAYGDRIVPILKPNGGQASAFNAGISAARGEFVHFLDADDLLHPNAVAQYIDLFDDPEVVKVHGPLEVIDKAGNPLSKLWPSCKLSEGSMLETTLRYGPASYCSCVTSGNVWRRTFLTAIAPIPEDAFRVSADAYLFTLSPLFGSFRKVDAPLGSYRYHGANLWLNTNTRIDAHRLRREVEQFELRLQALQDWAEKLGHVVDVRVWRRRYWRLTVYKRMLALMKEENTSLTVSDLLGGIQYLRVSRLKRLMLYPLFTAFWMAPTPFALRIGYKLLHQAGMGCGPRDLA